MSEELQNAISNARKRASKVGALHADWDVIFDAEALIAGKETLHDWGERERAIQILTERLNRT